MKNSTFDFVADMMKRFTNLSFLDFKLIFIFDRKPFTSSVDLDSWSHFFFERRFFYDFDNLAFDEARFASDDTDVDNAFWDGSTGNKNFLAFGCAGKSFSTEDEFFDSDI